MATGSASTAATGNMVVNGGFENGLTGWKTNLTGVSVRQTAPGHTGSYAATIGTTNNTVAVLNDAANTESSTTAKATYAASAWVRTSTPGVTGDLRLREVNASVLAGQGKTSFTLSDTAWHQVSLKYVAVKSGSSLDLNVLGYSLGSSKSIAVDDVTLTKTLASNSLTTTSSTTTTTAPSPTASAPATAPTVSSGTSFSAKGISTNHVALFGAAVGSNTNPATLESSVGNKLGLHRTYWGPGQVDSAVSSARADIAAHRVPWVSFKLPYSWADMANGKGDAWAKDLATKLGALPGPVWVAFHHEPEGDGPISDWRRMQIHLSPIFKAKPNIAFTIIITGWHEFFSGNATYSLDAMWPGDGLVDIIGMDPYNEYGVTKNGKLNLTMLELNTYYAKMAPFAAAHHTHWAVAETGYTNLAAQKDAQWLTRAYNDMNAAGGVGLAYFDSSLNPIADSTWTLEGTPKLPVFATVLAKTPHV